MKSLLHLGDLLPAFLSLLSLFQRCRFSALLGPVMCLRRRPLAAGSLGEAEAEAEEEEEEEEKAEEEGEERSLLDLPDLVVETILSKLPAHSLCRVSAVSKELLKRCSSDHLWMPHLASRWSCVAGNVAYEEWKDRSVNMVSPCKAEAMDLYAMKPLLLAAWPLSCLWNHWTKLNNAAKIDDQNCCQGQHHSHHHQHQHRHRHHHHQQLHHRQHHYHDSHCTAHRHQQQLHHHHHHHHHHYQRQQQLQQHCPHDNASYMRWFATLESGSFWFPAQVYNREHGHVGFLLSCYDAEVCYDRHSDTFTARYPPHGSCSLLIEEGIAWHRLRAPPIAARAHELYVSDPLDDLRPGDHVEVQWRRNKRFPYGWWYGVVGHLSTCDGDPRTCCCGVHDLVWLEFNQYAPGSRWRRTSIERQNHREKGNDNEGFYAGVRKLCSEQEIGIWRKQWPMEPLE